MTPDPSLQGAVERLTALADYVEQHGYYPTVTNHDTKPVSDLRTILAALPEPSAESGEREEVGDLTTPMEPNALYLTEADVVTFLAKDVVTVARRVGERFDVLLSMDRSEIVGFQINDAATFGQYLMSLKPAPKPPEKPRG